MKQNGFNAVRVSHNPASKVLLEVCDEVGMYVMDELADTWYNDKAPGDNGATFLEEWKADLDAMQTNNRLHASVIINSLCNEPTEPSTRYGLNLCKEIVARAKANDPTRPVTMGVNLMIASMSWPKTYTDDGVTPSKPSALSSRQRCDQCPLKQPRHPPQVDSLALQNRSRHEANLRCLRRRWLQLRHCPVRARRRSSS